MISFSPVRVVAMAALMAPAMERLLRPQPLAPDIPTRSISEVCSHAIRDAKNSFLKFTYPDGSHFEIPIELVIEKAAKSLSVGGVNFESIVQNQLLPALDDDPSLLMELGWRLTLDDHLLLATRYHLLSPGQLLHEAYGADAATMYIGIPKIA